jgi:anthranilate phosphoribosyltransferase
VLGPLTNPAGAGAQVVGVYDTGLTSKLGKVLTKLGTVHTFVVHGDGGLDEISLSGPAFICEVSNGDIREYLLDPASYGLSKAPLEALTGGLPEENASIALDVLRGGRGPRRDAVLINATLGLIAAGVVSDIAEGLARAAESIDKGAALFKLEQLVRFTNRSKRLVTVS